MIFLYPLNLILLFSISAPIIIHLYKRHFKKEIEYPALIFLLDKKIPQSRIHSLKHLLLLLIRILMLSLIAMIVSSPLSKFHLPFGERIASTNLILDVSGSMNPSEIKKYENIIDKLKPFISNIILTGSYHSPEIIALDSVYDFLENNKTSEIANIPATLILSAFYKSENTFIYSDNQLISWDISQNYYENTFSIDLENSGTVFNIKGIVNPPWWISGDTSYFYIITNDIINLNVKSSSSDTTYVISDNFIPVYLSEYDDNHKVIFSSGEDALTIIFPPNRDLKFYTNDMENFQRFFTIFPDAVTTISEYPESANFVFISEKKEIKNLTELLTNLSNSKKVFIFLDDGNVLGPWLNLNYSVRTENKIDTGGIVSFGVKELFGIISSGFCDIETSAEITSYFDNGKPALIKIDNIYIFSFNPDNSTMLWHNGFFIYIINEMFSDLPPPSIYPDMPDGERDNRYIDNLDSINIKTININQAIITAENQMYFNNRKFYVFFLLLLLIFELIYIKLTKIS